MKRILRKFLIYLITVVMVVPSCLITNYLTAESAMAATPTLDVYTISNDFISPNGLGAKSTSIDLKFSEPVKVTLDILNVEDIVVKKLYTSPGVTNPDPKIWDGTDDNGAVLADGEYTVQVDCTSLSTAESVLDKSKTISIDKISPMVSSVVQSEQTITYTFNEAVQLRDSVGTVLNSDTYASSLAIYEKNAYLAHQVGEPEPAHIGKIETATLSADGKTLSITYSGSLVNKVDTSYVVDAWGKNITDLAGNKMAQDVSQIFNVSADIAGPTAKLSSDYLAATKDSPIKFTLKCNEEIVDFNPSMLIITNGTAPTNSESADSKDFTFNVTPVTEGAVTIQLPVGAISDLVGNANADSASVTVDYDKTLPAITLKGDKNVTLNLGSAYVELGATAVDNNLDLTSKIVIDNSLIKTSAEGSYPVTYTVSDEAGNKKVETRTVTVLKPTQTVATSGMAVSVPTEIVVPKDYKDNMDINVTTGGTTLNLAASMTSGLDVAGVAYNKSLVNGSTKISSTISSGNTVVVEMASGTTVTGPATWNGIVKLPEVTVNPTSVTVNSGNYPTNVASIEIGMPDVKLTFDKAVRILIPGAANRSVGYTRSDVFAPINTVCPADKQSDVDESMKLLPEGDCKINSADGKDLVIWTKHFTKFVTYDQSLVTSPTFTAVVVDKDGAKYLDINWKGTGADAYFIKVNGVLISTITASANDTALAYNSSLKVLEGIKYTVTMVAKKNGVESINNLSTIVDVPAAVIVAQPTVVSAPTPVTEHVATVAPAKAQAAAPEEKKVETPKDADAGIVKGTDTNTAEDTNNWTPWIILFILILLAGAATGGYFYWFSDKPEADVKVKTKVKGKTVEPVKIIAKQKETVKQVQSVKKAEIVKPAQTAKPAQVASKKNHKKTKRW